MVSLFHRATIKQPCVSTSPPNTCLTAFIAADSKSVMTTVGSASTLSTMVLHGLQQFDVSLLSFVFQKCVDVLVENLSEQQRNCCPCTTFDWWLDAEGTVRHPSQLSYSLTLDHCRTKRMSPWWCRLLLPTPLATQSRITSPVLAGASMLYSSEVFA